MKAFRMATLLLCAVAAIPLSMADAASPSALPSADAADSRVSILARTLVARMTLDEKIGQLLNVAPAIPRLGIPAYNWWTE
ncbi:MAG: hypothetical protein ACTHOJ_06420, partial [Sphingomonas oligoaromativorans]